MVFTFSHRAIMEKSTYIIPHISIPANHKYRNQPWPSVVITPQSKAAFYMYQLVLPSYIILFSTNCKCNVFELILSENSFGIENILAMTSKVLVIAILGLQSIFSYPRFGHRPWVARF